MKDKNGRHEKGTDIMKKDENITMEGFGKSFHYGRHMPQIAKHTIQGQNFPRTQARGRATTTTVGEMDQKFLEYKSKTTKPQENDGNKAHAAEDDPRERVAPEIVLQRTKFTHAVESFA